MMDIYQIQRQVDVVYHLIFDIHYYIHDQKRLVNRGKKREILKSDGRKIEQNISRLVILDKDRVKLNLRSSYGSSSDQRHSMHHWSN
jgi:hypothetical protein